MSYFRALATDDVGTIAHGGIVDEETIAALAARVAAGEARQAIRVEVEQRYTEASEP